MPRSESVLGAGETSNVLGEETLTFLQVIYVTPNFSDFSILWVFPSTFCLFLEAQMEKGPALGLFPELDSFTG